MKIPGARAAQPHREKKPGASAALGSALFFIFGMGFMAALQSVTVSSHAHGPATTTAPLRSQTQLAHTPGGDFEYIRVPLEEPKGYLPDTSRPLPAPCWVFDNYTQEALSNLIQACEFTAAQRQSLLDPRRWQLRADGIALSPPPEIVLEMSRSARGKIYSILSTSEANSPQHHPFRFPPANFESWLSQLALGDVSQELLRKLTYTQSGATCFCDGAIAQRLLSPAEFQRLVDSLYREPTFIMRLIINPHSDIEGIIRYWHKGGRAEAIRPLLQSMAKVRGGAALNISYLLPPLAEVRLYTFAEHDEINENCFWTAMNFFNAKPDPQFLHLENTCHALAENYRPIAGQPIYGDLVVFEDSSAKPIHMCVYLTDDVVFTKNGANPREPWVLMKIPDVLACYELQDHARLRIYRSIAD